MSGTIPYTSSGKTEQLVRNIHVAVGLAAMLVQLLILDFVTWFYTTGMASPIFIIIIGIAYGFLSSAESDEEYLRYIVEPMVDKVTEEDRGRYLQFRKTTRRLVLILGYANAAIFQLFWISLTNMGGAALPALLVVFPTFAIVVVTIPTPFLAILGKMRYQDIKHLLDAEREDVRFRLRTGNLGQTTYSAGHGAA